MENILKQIARLFQRARKDAEDYVDVADSSQVFLNSRQTAGFVRLHLKLKNIIGRRQKTTKSAGFERRAQWAMYKKEKFITLIINLKTKVDDLEALISVAYLRLMLGQMRMENAEEVQNENREEIKLVQDSAKDVDSALKNAVKHFYSGHSFNKTEIGNYSAVQMGDSVAEKYSDFFRKHIISTLIFGSAKTHRSRWAIYMEKQCSIRLYSVW